MTSFRYTNQTNNSKSYWINELESLGISSKKIKDYFKNNTNEELVSITELADLVEIIKQTMYQEYKTAYSERMFELGERGGEEYVITS